LSARLPANISFGNGQIGPYPAPRYALFISTAHFQSVKAGRLVCAKLAFWDEN
jgi:hypothetical protein